MYSCYTIGNRAELVEQVKPAYKRVVCHHVTYQYPDTQPAPDAESVLAHTLLTGYGIQCLLVQVDFSGVRTDNGYYHVTVSLDEGKRPVESNWLIKQWLNGDMNVTRKTFNPAIKLEVTPELLK